MEYKGEDAVRMTLSGRVPVKVSLENGPVAIGDALTSSNVAGVAMRATGAGRVIGLALEPFDGSSTSTQITAFINTHWQGGDLTVFQNSQGQLVNTELQQELSSFGLIINEYGVLEVGILKTQKLCVGSVCVTEEDFIKVFGANLGIILTSDNNASTSEADTTVCENGVNRPCSNNVGACQIGVEICEQGVLGECIGAILPSNELCDGVDNDCDGETDEEDICSMPLEESPVLEPQTEVCDGADNNLDGQTDEGMDCGTTSCDVILNLTGVCQNTCNGVEGCSVCASACSCIEGFSECDGDASNGCEIASSTCPLIP